MYTETKTGCKVFHPARSPKQRYAVIYADPPWSFRVWNRDTGSGRSAESHYPTMSIEDLIALPVGDLAAPDCALFMWACWPSLPDAIRLGEAWGFTYKTLAFDWLKLTSTGQHWHIGMGYYTRANSEPCLLFTKGKPHRKDKGVRQLIVDDTEMRLELPIVGKIGRHSQKPISAYERIEQLVEGPYLELFARNSYPGWDCWGNEAPNGIAWTPRVKAAAAGR